MSYIQCWIYADEYIIILYICFLCPGGCFVQHDSKHFPDSPCMFIACLPKQLAGRSSTIPRNSVATSDPWNVGAANRGGVTRPQNYVDTGWFSLVISCFWSFISRIVLLCQIHVCWMVSRVATWRNCAKEAVLWTYVGNYRYTDIL